MKIITTRILILTSFFITGLFTNAQVDPWLKPSQATALFQDYIDKEQKMALKSDGKDDKLFTVSTNEDINIHVTTALIEKINQLQRQIEKDTAMANQVKVKYLRGIERLLKDMNANWRPKKFTVISLPSILGAYENCMEVDRKGKSIENIIGGLDYDVAKAIVNCSAFDNNPGFKTSKYILIKKFCTLYPEQILATLKQEIKYNPDLPFADSLVRVAAYRYPKQLYDYAAATNELSAFIKKIDDPLIRAVSEMTVSNSSGQLYFPFLDNIIKGKITLADIDAVRNDSIQYFRLLVKTHLDYVEQSLNKDTARSYADLEDMLQRKAQTVFVNTINGLHERDDVTRFRIIQPLNAQELYYLAVLSDGIIYTSSFVKGVFPLMMSRINNRGDSILKTVMFDHYRKFIKMAAGYNTLGTFLGSFGKPEDASDLMRAFVTGLEKKGSLEDGVDVADSYASIVEINKSLADEMLNNVNVNYQRNISQNNKKGTEIYKILDKLFLSSDSTKKIDLTKELGIPPVYTVPYSSLVNNDGQVIMQVFFYGDKDGQNIFGGFQKMFSSANWKISPEKKWISISSLKGLPVIIYANRPLPEETGEDEQAQKALDSFLLKKGLKPTVVIHRGHSYYAKYTIEQILPSAKIVFMGSCGGYHLIHDILKNAPDAHIIASKQIGKTAINRPFFDLLMEKLRTGKNIEWSSFWKEFQQRVKVEGFEDYIPPQKNLGAIFIKAFNIAMGEAANPIP